MNQILINPSRKNLNENWLLKWKQYKYILILGSCSIYKVHHALRKGLNWLYIEKDQFACDLNFDKISSATRWLSCQPDGWVKTSLCPCYYVMGQFIWIFYLVSAKKTLDKKSEKIQVTNELFKTLNQNRHYPIVQLA